MSFGYRAERLFAELCSRHFLRGFVFHSPKFFHPTEREAGDVVLWVRRQVIVVEILARDAEFGSGTKQYVKRIGEKREQLARDFRAFVDPQIRLELTNEQGELVEFDTLDLGEVGFAGIILLDCDDQLEKPHYQSVEKTLQMPFPIAIMTRRDFIDLLDEVDTIPDLSYYLADRAEFVRCVYSHNPEPFLNLNARLERNLVSFYKLHNNRFPLSDWRADRANDYQRLYRELRGRDIAERNSENGDSHLIDELVELLRTQNRPDDSTLLHSWELATLTRRQRAAIAPKVADAIERMQGGKPERHFAFFNQATGCWLVFFFQYGGDRVGFRARAASLTRQKLFVEIVRQGFTFSVFGYSFRKGTIDTGSTFDEVVLSVEDASKYERVPEDAYQEALNYFGSRVYRQVTEFPDDR